MRFQTTKPDNDRTNSDRPMHRAFILQTGISYNVQSFANPVGHEICQKRLYSTSTILTSPFQVKYLIQIYNINIMNL